MALLSVLFVLFVIIAGGIVRATGSGMGCPDWPRCFGLMVPPTEEAEVLFQPNKAYSKGVMVIFSDTLWVANSGFTSDSSFDRSQWHRYPKHNYAVFNAAHTWTEFINRLIGVLCGLAVLVLTITGFVGRKHAPNRFWWSLLALVLTAFQAWIGAKVVDTLLAGYMVTLHMFIAIVILFILQWVHVDYISAGKKLINIRLRSVFSLLLLTVQVLMGTRVRELVDEGIETGISRSGVLEAAGSIFSIHSIFYLAVISATGYWIYPYMSKGMRVIFRLSVALIAVLAVEICSGFLLKALDLPFWLQPVHLVLANIALCLGFYLFCLEHIPEDKSLLVEKP